MSRPPRLRFAPSPTGYLHVGGARTAIFNLLHARRYGGTMILRIEDTDVERSQQRHAEQIISSLQWLGVEWDEGPVYQSDRLDRYRERAAELVDRGLAYRCNCTVEQLEAERAEAEREGRAWRYSGRCREAAMRGEVRGEPFVIRCTVPAAPIVFEDLIRGEVTFDGELIDDFVILRSDGNPTYHLSVVVDDIDMDVTVVARGDDHLSNTPKHIVLFRAFGVEPPRFAHLPLILGSDRKRLSKRTGATSAEEYRDLGILPEALFNFLTLLGWSPGENREIFSRDEAVSWFDLSGVNRAAAVFDVEKLLWLNGQYLTRMETREILPHLAPFLSAGRENHARLAEIAGAFKSRVRTLRELADAIAPLVGDDDALEYEPEAVAKHVRGDDLGQRLTALREAYATVEPFDVETTEKVLRDLATAGSFSAGKLIHPLRLAMTGRGSSPPVFDVAVAIGRDATLRRLDQFIRRIPELSG